MDGNPSLLSLVLTDLHFVLLRLKYADPYEPTCHKSSRCDKTDLFEETVRSKHERCVVSFLTSTPSVRGGPRNDRLLSIWFITRHVQKGRLGKPKKKCTNNRKTSRSVKRRKVAAASAAAYEAALKMGRFGRHEPQDGRGREACTSSEMELQLEESRTPLAPSLSSLGAIINHAAASRH